MALFSLRFLIMYSVLMLPGAWSTAGFIWPWRQVWNNEGWGQFCFDLTEYKPSCGWKLVLRSSFPLSRIEVWDSTYATSDNYVFTLTNNSFSGDFKYRDSCSNLNIMGPFGNVSPDLVITWYCVCDATTNGECKNVISPSATNSLTDNSEHILLGTYNNVTKYTSTNSGNCYKGDHAIQLIGGSHFVDCGTTCAALSKCTGFNYRALSKQCDLVYEITSWNPNLMVKEEGCIFWSVYRV